MANPFAFWFRARRALLPAVQCEAGLRAHVYEDDLLALDNGHFRAAFAVPGEPLDRASDEDARAFLSHLAYALNALPPGVLLLARREPGTERAHLSRERQRLDAGSVATALVPLREARLAHLSGTTSGRRAAQRRVFVLAVDAPSKDEANRRAAKIEGGFGPLGVLRLRGEAIPDDLSRRWRGTPCPPRDHFQYFQVGDHTLVYGAEGARADLAPRREA